MADYFGQFEVSRHATVGRRLTDRQVDLFIATLLFSHVGPASEHEVTHGIFAWLPTGNSATEGRRSTDRQVDLFRATLLFSHSARHLSTRSRMAILLGCPQVILCPF